MAMKAALTEPEIVTRKDKPVSVILPIKDYGELLERMEDAEDAARLKCSSRINSITVRWKSTSQSEMIDRLNHKDTKAQSPDQEEQTSILTYSDLCVFVPLWLKHRM
jgi:hypothetical protein